MKAIMGDGMLDKVENTKYLWWSRLEDKIS